MAKEETNVHSGHRERMRDKFFRHGAEVFDSYELLEMLLYFRIPYKDTNPIAHRLLNHFGSLDRVFHAEVEELCRIDGVGEQVARYIRYAGNCGLDGFLLQEKAPVFNDYDRVGEYLLSVYERDKDPMQTYMLLLDNRMCLVALEPMGNEPFAEANIPSFVEKALLASAAVVILATNHVHGPLFILPEERVADANFKTHFEMAGLIYAEHYIFCGRAYIGCLSHKDTSFRQQYRALKDFENSRRAQGESRVCAAVSSSIWDQEGLGPCDSARDYLYRLISPACSEAKREQVLRSLLDRFGMVRRILETDSSVLAETPGVGRKVSMYIKLLVALTSRRITDAFTFGTIHSAAQLKKYFTYLMLGEHVECIYMLMLDGRGAAIACERVTEGSVNSSTITPRRFLEIAVRYRAKQIIIAHNHPCGSAVPSEDDYRATSLLHSSLEAVGIHLMDHYIVAGPSCVSMGSLSSAKMEERYEFTVAPKAVLHASDGDEA